MAFKKNCLNSFLMPALLRPKIVLLNLDMHQFSYNKQLIHLKKHLKRSLCIEFKENSLSHFSLRESFLKPKIGIPNLDLHQCFYSKDYFIRKDM